jgi:hypothetical protein
MRFRIPWLTTASPAENGSDIPQMPSPDTAGEPLRNEAMFSVPVTYMNSEVPEINSAFGYGHLDGNRGVPKEHFANYIESSVELEHLETEIASVEAENLRLRESASDIRSARGRLADLHHRKQVGQARLEELRSRFQRDETTLGTKIEEFANARHKGSVAYSIIYGTAAALFILGDIVITQTIVADAMELPTRPLLGVPGLSDAMLFALGLAMVAILLKPGYDRLVERPFHEGRERPFQVAIGVAAVLALSTLLVLGIFRTEAHQAELIGQMLEEGQRPAGVNGSLEDVILGVAGSFWSKAAFVLSGVLFAVGGTICLGIGMRYFHGVVHGRRRLKAEIRLLESAVRRAQSEIHAQESQSREVNRDLLLETARLEGAPDPHQLETLAVRQAERLPELREAARHARTRRLQSLYRDGYELGQVRGAEERFEMDARAADAVPAEQEPPAVRRRRPRPFIAVRRLIRNQFTPTEVRPL